MDLAQLAIKADSSELVKAKRDLDAIPSSAKKAEGATSSLATSYQKMGMVAGKAIGGIIAAIGAMAVAAVGFAKSAIDMADANLKASQAIGIQIEKLTALQFAAAQSGVSTEGLNGAMKRFSKTLDEASQGSKTALSAFSDIGITLKDSEGNLKATDILLLEISDKFAGLQDSSAKTALAMELFGRAGADLIPLLNGGSKSIQDLMNQAKELGLVMDTQTAKAAEQFNDSLSLLGAKVRGVGNNILKEMLPVMQDLTGLFMDLGTNTNITTSLTTAFSVSLKSLVSVGLFVANVLSVVGKNIGAIAAAAVAFVSGDFSQSMEIIRQRKFDRYKEDEQYTKSQANLWNGEYAKAAQNAAEVNSDLEKAKSALVRTSKEEESSTSKAAKAQAEYAIQINAQIDDLKAVNALVMQGMELDEARLIISETRKGATAEQIKALQEQLNIQADIAEKEQARQDRLQVWIKTQQKAYDDELKAIEDVKKAQQKASDDYLREVKRAEEERLRELERTNEAFSRSLTDAIFRGFEQGKSFAQNFKDALINSFKTLVLQPVIKFLVDGSGIAGVISSITGALTGGGNSLVAQQGGGFGGLLGTVKSIFNGGNSAIIGGIEGIGATIANGLGGIRDTIGGFVGANAGVIASLSSFSGAALSLLKGDFKGAAFQGAGAGIGTLLGGPIGGAIGSFLGGAVGGLFGGKKQPPRTVSQLPDVAGAFSGQLSALLGGFGLDNDVTASARYAGRKKGSGYGNLDANINGQSFSLAQRDRKAYSEASMNAFVNKVLTTELVRAIQSTQLSGAIKDLFTGLNTQEGIRALINDVVRLNGSAVVLNQSLDITVDQVAMMAKEGKVAGENFTKLVDVLIGVGGEALTIGDAILNLKGNIIESIGISLPNSLKAYDDALRAVNASTVEGRADFLELLATRDVFKQFDGLITGLQNNVRNGLFSIVSESEKQAMQQEDLAKLFGELNLTVPKSIQELITLGKSIDFTTKEGLNLASVFPQLVDAFSQTKGAVDSLINSLNPNRFATFADFAIGSSLSRQGVPLNLIPSMGASAQSSGANDDRVAELLTRLIAEVSEMKTSTQETANNTLKTTRELEDITGGSVTLNTQVA